MNEVKLIILQTASEAIKRDFGKRGTPGSAGIDVMANIKEPITLIPGGAAVMIPTGIKMWIDDPNKMAIIAPRSGQGHKRGLIMGNTVAIIDSDYQGEWMVSAWSRPNGNDEPIVIQPDERIAQLIFVPIDHPVITIVDSFGEETKRGAGGFGSTGV